VNGAMRAVAWILAVAAVLPWVWAVHADEAAIRAALEPRLGKIDRVVKSQVPGIWEVLTGPQVQYADETGRFLFSGPLQDAKTGRNLTAERQFELLPLKLAIMQTRGSGKNVLVTFEDPNCVYCKRLAKELAKIPDLRLYTFVIPILGPDSQQKARNIWCAPDRAAAWNAQMLIEVAAPKARDNCDSSALQKTVEVARQLGIRGTPVMYLAGGEVIRGFTDAQKLEERMKERST
jgi:thiol:disulfide interchange protein DsbC